MFLHTNHHWWANHLKVLMKRWCMSRNIYPTCNMNKFTFYLLRTSTSQTIYQRIEIHSVISVVLFYQLTWNNWCNTIEASTQPIHSLEFRKSFGLSPTSTSACWMSFRVGTDPGEQQEHRDCNVLYPQPHP